jgi:hypothetical protein
MPDQRVPNPGSYEAKGQGCRCPVVDNHHGKGIPWPGCDKPQFWINADCPLHGGNQEESKDA